MDSVDFINSSVEQIKQTDLLKHIELCGRVCYKSEDKITSDSAEKFVRNIVKRGHTSVLEHGTVYITINFDALKLPENLLLSSVILGNPHTFYKIIMSADSPIMYITTNFRVVLQAHENDLESALAFVKKYATSPTEHILRHTFRITCDRGVSHELVRHRVFSFSQESTRYVNSTKRGFMFVKPTWWNDELMSKSFIDVHSADDIIELKKHNLFINSCKSASKYYSELISLGQTPQQARAVLPNAIKTEVVMTGTVPQWGEFLKLRTDKAAHPDMQIVANKIKELLLIN